MKKIVLILLLSIGVYATTSAQTTSAPASPSVSKQKDKANKEAIAAQKKADRQAKALEKKQTKAAANSSAATDNATMAAQKKADEEAKTLAKKQAKEANQVNVNNSPVSTAHLNKNGSPDKRFKSNKNLKTTTTPTSDIKTPPTVSNARKQTAVINPANTANPADKAISKDAKGRTIYLGPRGGKYYIDKNGKKEYVK